MLQSFMNIQYFILNKVIENLQDITQRNTLGLWQKTLIIMA